MTHTPGPWRVHRTIADVQPPGIIHTPHGSLVVQWDSTASVSQRQHDADARLIAAAPDLYAALSRHVAMLDRLLKCVDLGKSFLDGETIGEWNEAAIEADRALAKARGAS